VHQSQNQLIDRLSVRLFVVSRPVFDMEAFLRFLESEQQSWERMGSAKDSESIVEAAGRICYMSFGQRQYRRPNAEYVANLIKQGHESVLEHVSWSFVLTGVSRAFSHQFVRHRVGFAFSQLSQQYHEERDARFVEPAIIRSHPHLSTLWRSAVEGSRQAYASLLESLEELEQTSLSLPNKREMQRAVRTAARSVLPNATETKIFFTANARALRHFLELRGNIAGDEEMRVVSCLLLESLKKEAPSLFDDFMTQELPDGLPRVVKGAPQAG